LCLVLLNKFLTLNKILLIQTASIGDVILVTPTIENIHQVYPLAQIDILIKKGNEALFENHPFITNVITWDKTNNKYINLVKIITRIRKNKYDAVVTFQRFLTTGLITVFSGANIKIGFNKNPLSFLFNKKCKHTQNNIHEINRNLELISLITNHKKGNIKLYPSEKDFEQVKIYKTEHYICIAPASLWYTKQFPINKWAEFIKSINSNVKIYFIGSKSDFNICKKIIEISNYKNYEILCGKISLLECAALMKNAKMNFVNDSAPLHIASAMNAPVTVIYCSTIPDFGFGPLSEKSFIIQTKEKLNCRPCGIHGRKKCPKKHFKCALSISINEIKKIIEK